MLLGAHIGVLVFLVLLKVKTPLAMTVAGKITAILPQRVQRRILELIEKFVSGLGVFNDWRGLTKILLWSLLIWVVVGFSNYFIFLAFDLSVPWFAPYVLLVVVSLGVMLPSSPAFVGPFQFATVLALGLFGIGRETSIPFSLVLHFGNFVPVTLLGLYYLRREHFTLRQIEEEVA
jgi:uncharacterized protein (TIRG00374 family)